LRGRSQHGRQEDGRRRSDDYRPQFQQQATGHPVLTASGDVITHWHPSVQLMLHQAQRNAESINETETFAATP
jgi:hypothetical protein